MNDKKEKFLKDHPIICSILYSLIIKSIIKTYNKLTSSYFWLDISFHIKKIIKFPVRVWELKKVIYNDYDWGFNSILDIILFKLNKLQKCLDEGHYVGCEVNAREVRIAIEHIKRYKDISDYTIDYEYDGEIDGFNFEVVQVDENNKPVLYTHTEKDPKRAEKRMRIHMAQERLSQWHWQQLWKLINDKGQSWSD